MALIIFTDGCSLGNPGPMGIGVVAYRFGKKVREIGEHIGEGTNNVAEYTAAIRALEFARKEGEREVRIRADSQLLVRQLNGEYRVRDAKLKPLKRRIEELCSGMSVAFEHIPREQNEEADALSKKGAEEGKRKKKSGAGAGHGTQGIGHRKAGQQKLEL